MTKMSEKHRRYSKNIAEIICSNTNTAILTTLTKTDEQSKQEAQLPQR